MSHPSKRILVADDDNILRHLLVYNLKKAGYEPVVAINGREAISFAQGEFACALIDIMMPELDGMSVLYHLKRNLPDVPVIMVSSIGQSKAAVQTINNGAFAYVTKPFDVETLMATVESAVRIGEAMREKRALKDAFRRPMPEAEFVAISPASAQVMAQVKNIIASDVSVLITGEAGVGKGFLAHTIHLSGKRADLPFVIANCHTLPRESLDASFLGRDSGTLKNDPQRSLGFFEMTGEGTLLLDEIGHLPRLLQPKILSVLQNREFKRIGGLETVSSACRVIAVTRFNLEQQVASREFHKELFEHLSAVHIFVPPLRERIEDLPLLCRQVLARLARDQSKEALDISPSAMAVMQSYPWPGNVRELETLLERASILCEDFLIEKKHLKFQHSRSSLRKIPSGS